MRPASHPGRRAAFGLLLALLPASAWASYRNGEFAVIVLLFAAPAASMALLLGLVLRASGVFRHPLARRLFVAAVTLPVAAMLLYALPSNDGSSVALLAAGLPLLASPACAAALWRTGGTPVEGLAAAPAPRWAAGYWMARGALMLATAVSRALASASVPGTPDYFWWTGLSLAALGAIASMAGGGLMWRRRRGALPLLLASLVAANVPLAWAIGSISPRDLPWTVLVLPGLDLGLWLWLAWLARAGGKQPG